MQKLGRREGCPLVRDAHECVDHDVDSSCTFLCLQMRDIEYYKN